MPSSPAFVYTFLRTIRRTVPAPPPVTVSRTCDDQPIAHQSGSTGTGRRHVHARSEGPVASASQSATQQSYLEAVNERVVVFDGAFGTYVQGLDLTADDFGGPALEGCNEMLCLTRPDVIAGMHEAFFDVGVDAVETASFGSFSTVLTEYDVADQAHELNVAAARIAREVADGYSADGRARYVAGSIGPGTKLPSLGHIGFAELRDAYEEQANGLLVGGVDLFLIETCMDLLQVKAAMIGCRRAMAAEGRQVPMQVQVTMETTGRMLVGSEIGAALVVDRRHAPRRARHQLRHRAGRDAGAPALPQPALAAADQRAAQRRPAEHRRRPHPLRPHARAAGRVPPPPRRATSASPSSAAAAARRPSTCARSSRPSRTSSRPAARPSVEPSVSSIYSPVPIEQDLSFLIIGERTNANGSKAFRDAMLEGDWDQCTKMANEQVREGAHVLDVCVDYVGRDGAVDMDEIAKRFATQASVPLVMDSTEALVLEAGLQHIGGRAILNSANLEDGELPGSRFDKVMTLAREYGAAVICLLIDERGQARDVEWKMEIAHRIHEIAVERYGLSASDLIFDTLTFPLSTGDDDLRRDAMYTMEAIKRIKAEIPGAHTTLGVSNVSFGLHPPARHALNSVFLHEAVEAGLDSAIVHAGKIVPLNRLPEEQRQVCLDLIYDRRTDTYDPLQELLEVFADVKSTKTEKLDRSGQPVEERLHHRIIDGDRDGLTADLDEALGSGLTALQIVNDVLLGGMKVVGELFGSGQMQLPFVLQSAETMKAAVAFLEPHMERVDGSSAKGKLVIATVKGDVHDIGKNLVDIICTNNGYEVHNLGIKVAIGEMVAKVKEVDADALGMSGLLVKSTLIMRDNLQELNSLGLSEVPVLLGGAALTRRYVERDLREIYDGRLFYGRDAFEGLSTLDALMGMKRSGTWDPDFGTVPTGRELPERSNADAPAVELPRRSPDVAVDNEVFVAAVHRLPRHQGHRARRHRRVRQRDRAVPQPVAVPPGEGRRRQAGERRRVQVPHPLDLPRAARRGQGLRRARAPGRVRVLPGQRRRRRPRGVDRRDPHHRGGPLPLPPPEGGAVPVHRRLLPARRIGRGRLRRVPHRHDGRGRQRGDGQAVRRQRVPAVPAAARARRGDGRGAGRVLAPPHPRGVGVRRRGRPDHRRAVPPAVPRRPLLVGLPGVPGAGGQRHGGPAARRRPARHRGQRGDGLAVPARADDLGDHLPPPPVQVLRRPLTRPAAAARSSFPNC